MGALADRVAVVTGAGRGIGREHALLLAREGAAVVVNDLGSSAQEVAEEIRAAGGHAVANGDDIATWPGGAALVAQAIEEYGRLDVVVNNAGILRDAFIPAMEEAEWDAVIAVHLKGHFSVLRHAAAYWKVESKAGRQPTASVVNTISGSGVAMPNPGQANYGAAKAGIAALTLVAAAELDRYGVRVNAIAPLARTQLSTSTPMLEAFFATPTAEGAFDTFDPANISPLVAYLATEGCRATGQVYEVQGGAITRLEGWHRVDAAETDGPWTVESVAASVAGWATGA